MSRVRPRARADVHAVELDGELVIWDATTGELHHLNRTASAVLSLCDGTATICAIVDELAHAFGEAPERIDTDVRRLIRRLRRARLLEPSGR